MDIRGALFALADLFMVYAGFTYGWKFIRNYKNYLLGLEWIIVATSGTNFLMYGLLGLRPDSTSFHIAIFFDAFSRSVGITVILVLGLMVVTHGYKPSRAVDIGVFALAGLVGLGLTEYALRTMDPATHHVGLTGALFLVAMNLLTTVFLLYFAARLWNVGERIQAVRVVIVTFMGFAVAVTYDFYDIPGDDANRTLFYIVALTTWGLQMIVYHNAYRALHNHNRRPGPLSPLTIDQTVGQTHRST
ncbi:transporter [Mycobacteroides immunogenum]|uniref:transporter n=1 Tax=Mycobacteroides immunogenum TaxID=83262 RepID=UPI0025B73DA4|nr:transporter [Mycobacteroides immunogenum]WJR33732.1 transporter [Mycobacteroides immunogenum]